MTDARRRIPGVDRLLASPECAALLARYPADRVSAHLKGAVAGVRARIEAGDVPESVERAATYVDLANATLAAQDASSLRSVINATGVVLHTNLGRAPLSQAALAAMARVGDGYVNLEFDLESGRRGSRYVHSAGLLCELTGAEDALAVNNCAAALVLALNTLALGRRVVVSRGELVEIGGGFRIPEILSRSGAELVEVGSTNRTRLADYRTAIDAGGVGALLKVHRSNFRISGFTEEADLESLARLAAESAVPLVHDLGSGLMVDPSRLGLPAEPRPAESVSGGADVVVFSGDKLLGGPQAGLVVGRGTYVARMRENPLCRALRVDKGTLAALEATLGLYRDVPRAIREIPTLHMLATPVEALADRARAMAERAREHGCSVAVVASEGAVGGGTYPGVALESRALRLEPSQLGLNRVAQRLRSGDPAVVARREDGALLLDLRTVDPAQDDALLARLVEATRELDEA